MLPRCCTTPSRDTEYSLDALTSDFGDDRPPGRRVTKLDRVTYGQSSAAETVRKMVVAMARDIRVLVIKAGRPAAQHAHDRLAAGGQTTQEGRRDARDLRPLAPAGMNTIKWELEDLSFAALQPKVYEEIVHLRPSGLPPATST